MSGEAVLAAGFDAALRARGVAAGTRRAGTFAAVLATLPPTSGTALYWRARTAMLPSIDDLAAFHAAFVDYFGSSGAGMLGPIEGAPAERHQAPVREALPPPPSAAPADPRDAARAPVQWIRASLEEALRERAFDELSAAERAAMLRLMGRARIARDLRRSRRRRPAPHGDRFDLAGSLRRAPRTAGEIVTPSLTRRRWRERPLVFLVDISGSMEAFARSLVQYARVAARARPRVRTFTFATRLTEVSALLRRASDADVMRALGTEVRDYGGGTRIGAALRAFNDRYAQRGAARGGTVVILSDGWEREDPALVESEMRRLRRLARRIVWVNPHKRHAAYEPLARGMAAAMPHLDAFVSGHNLRSLDDVADAIEGRTR